MAEQKFAPARVTPPPPWTEVARHGMFPEGNHDEAARFNFVASLNQHIAARVFPGNQLAYERRVKPEFESRHGRPPATRQEVRKAMGEDNYYQFWSALRRTFMEMRQENGRAMLLRQANALAEKTKAVNEGSASLELDPSLEMPRYLTAVDIHCAPGGYHSEVFDEDVTNPACYDAGLYATTGGLLGRLNDGGGRAINDWFDKNLPDLQPKRILDLGTGIGHNILPLAKRFPDAQIWAIDAAAPMLRYGHARAKSLGVDNVRFVQMNAEALKFDDNAFDLITTAMFWHETSTVALRKIMAEICRVLAPGGLTISLEQPPYRGMSPFEAFIRDWDSHNNNEPFWTTLHDMNMVDEMVAAGFEKEAVFETSFPMVPEMEFIKSDKDVGKAPGRGAGWYGFGAWKRQ